jgi:hypothetical protein
MEHFGGAGVALRYTKAQTEHRCAVTGQVAQGRGAEEGKCGSEMGSIVILARSGEVRSGKNRILVIPFVENSEDARLNPKTESAGILSRES